MRWTPVAMALCALLPGLARASNMTHPRTPVLWNDVPCMTLHDRSQGATVHLPYEIPFEDLEITPDEVADSRRHQFFAFCRPHHPQNFLPSWITADDVQAAADKMLLMVETVEPDDILENTTQWQDCWYRINEDADRRPIDQQHADQGIDWDTAGLPAGAYTLYGYTYEPVFNVWWLRPGVLKLHDGDPDAVGPVGAVSTGELTPFRDETSTIEGCVDAIAGTTYTVYWALVTADEPEWVEYQADIAIDGDAFAFDFLPPAELAGQSGMIRVDFKDPMQREYTTYQADNLLVINSDNPEACDDGGSFIGSPCSDSSGTSAGDSGDSGTGAGTGGSSDAGTGMGTTAPMQTGDDGNDPKGCACASETAPSSWSWLFALAGLTIARRRRAR
jgi:MYXO-CTERM domain-containing protein